MPQLETHFPPPGGNINREEEELVLSTLEPDQLATVKKHHLPRRQLRGGQLAILWLLRIYLLFMMAVVVYQVVAGK